MIRYWFAGSMAGTAIAALAACSAPGDAGEAVAQQPVAQAPGAPEIANLSPPQPPETPDAPDAPATGAVTFEDNAEQDGGTREFSYTWPAQVSAIPALVDQLSEMRAVSLVEQKVWWKDSMADCPPEFASCRNNTFELSWQVVADLPRFLSLSNGFYTYSGGAHGNYGRGALVWDREAGASIEPKKMFTSLDRLDTAISAAACTMLDKKRGERRGDETFRSDGEWPNQCVSMEETVLFLGSSGGAKFDRLGVYYAPYIAGPYAEGDFEFTLPVTQAVIDAVKPEYREAFAVK